MRKLYLSQTEVDNIVYVLTEQIKRSGRNFDVVVGIENGGLYVSHPIADILNLPHETVKISRYDGETLRQDPIVQKDSFDAQGRTCLIVDDLIDDGGTILAYDQFFGLQDDDAVAVLFWNPRAHICPKFYGLLKPKEWIVFPWETEGRP